MGWPGRKYNSAEYRYGFNGKEKDDEGEFGFEGLLETGANLPGQFAGSFSGDVFVGEKGENLIFIISDAKSRKSLLLRLGMSQREKMLGGEEIHIKSIFGSNQLIKIMI